MHAASVSADIALPPALRCYLPSTPCLTTLQELEASVATLVERGVVAESEIVAALQAVLPEQFQQLIPSELRNVVPQSPATVQQQAQEGFYEEPPLSAEQLSISQSGKYRFFLGLVRCINHIA